MDPCKHYEEVSPEYYRQMGEKVSFLNFFYIFHILVLLSVVSLTYFLIATDKHLGKEYWEQGGAAWHRCVISAFYHGCSHSCARNLL